MSTTFFCFQRFADNVQQCFAFKPQANFPTNNLNFNEGKGDGFGTMLPFKIFSTLLILTYELCSKYLPGAMCCGGITLFDALTNHSLCFGARKESLGHCWPQCSDIFFAIFFIGCRYVVRAQIPLKRVHCGLSDLIRGQKFAQCAHIGFAIRTIVSGGGL